jgi:hypothetical protein
MFDKFEDNGWEPLFKEVTKFCNENDIPVPNMNGSVPRWGRSRKVGRNIITSDHHFCVDNFYAAIDAITIEFDHRFNEASSELLVCFSCLDPRDSSKFDVDKLAQLREIYCDEFSNSDKDNIKDKLELFIIHVRSTTTETFSKVGKNNFPRRAR